VIETPIHGATHWDGLGHVFYDGAMWNGYDMRLCGVAGTSRNAITEMRDRLVGRGVLADIAGWKGVESMGPGEGILVSDLEACLDAQGVELREGDFLLVRTGQLGQCQRDGWGDYCFGAAPGFSLDTATWIRKKELAALATDTFGAEVRPNETTEMTQPWHHVVIPNVGITVGEMFSLDRLAEACADAGRYSFFLAAGALPIEHATGSPVNPIAVL
jgi:kynurenine formamidase